MRHTSSYITIVAVSFAGISAQAQTFDGFYAGVFAGSVSYEGGIVSFSEDSGSLTNGGILLGWRGEYGNYLYGVEADYGLPFSKEVGEFDCSAGVFPEPICAFENDAHLRALFGYSFNNIDVFGSVGVAYATLQQTGGATYDISGTSYGLGAEYSMSNGITLRLEGLQDNYDDFIAPSGYDGEWKNSTVRAAAIYKF